MKNLHAQSLALALLLLLGSAVVPANAEDFASSSLGANRVTWDITAGTYDRAVLTVSRPDGTVFRKEFKSTAQVAFDLADAAGNLAADGAYTWQIVLAPRLDAAQKDALAAARRTNDPAAQARILAANGLDKPRIQSGSFAVAGGSILPADLHEAAGSRAPAASRAPEGGGVIGNDVVTADDSIVQGSLCVGFDCVNNESFGFDTIRLKENSTRIKFDDTSVGSFPANDWQLTANDSASGGANKFSIEDITGSKVPFTVTAGAATNSIFVDSTGRLGLRTATPVLDVHINTSNTPAIRLEQNNSGGFTAQTWDVAGNEANFFVRDVTGGSRLPFRIRPGAPTSSVDISADGDVGIGTASPSNKLHVLSSGSAVDDGKVFIQNSSATSLARELLELRNNGSTLLILDDTGNASRWSFGSVGGNFVVDDQQDAAVEMSLTGAGNMTIGGTLTQGSSREIKDGFVAVDPKTVLAKVTALPLSQWSYKADGPTVRHLGPMAEDFAAAFGLGADDKHIAPSDQASVALLAVQGLNQVVQEKDQQLAALKARNDQLETRLANLEKMMQELAAKQK